VAIGVGGGFRQQRTRRAEDGYAGASQRAVDGVALYCGTGGVAGAAAGGQQQGQDGNGGEFAAVNQRIKKLVGWLVGCMLRAIVPVPMLFIVLPAGRRGSLEGVG